MSGPGRACRLCGERGAELSARPQLHELLQRYLPIEIVFDDQLPTEICDICADTVNNFHNFVEKCLIVQEELMRRDTLADLAEPSKGIKVEVKLETEGDNYNIKPDYDVDDQISNHYWEEDYDCTSDGSNKSSNNRDNIKITGRQKNASTQKDDSKKTDLLKQYIKFSCYVCEENFANWFRLKAHISQVHNQTPKVKCVCGCIVKSKTAIYRHVAGHNDPARFACNLCSRITKTQEALDKHMKRHLEKSKSEYTCGSCGKVFNNKECLKSHERVHIPLIERYNYPCSICGNRFTTKSAVAGHIRAVHDKLKRFVCDICGYACSTGGELVQHKAIHSDEKLFECNVCFKKFKTSSNLKAHLDTHADTSYTCSVCGKVLNSRRTLRKHFLVHDDFCKHKCTYCNRAFKRRQTLKVHLTTHTGAKPIQCPYCPEKFAYSSSFRVHKQKLHSDNVIVPKLEMKEMHFE